MTRRLSLPKLKPQLSRAEQQLDRILDEAFGLAELHDDTRWEAQQRHQNRLKSQFGKRESTAQQPAHPAQQPAHPAQPATPPRTLKRPVTATRSAKRAERNTRTTRTRKSIYNGGPNNKLTFQEVQQIRFDYSVNRLKQHVIAQNYGMSVIGISKLIRRKSWRYLPDIYDAQWIQDEPTGTQPRQHSTAQHNTTEETQ